MADATTAPPPLAFKKRAPKATQRKRPATPPPANSDSDASSDASDDESGTRVKRRKREGLTTNTSAIHKPAQDLSKATKFGADRSTNISHTNDATKASTWYTDAALAGESGSKSRNGGDDGAEVGNEGLYKGASSGYGSFIQKSANATEKKSVGPVKAPTNVRAITVTDFAPDVCKDYKQTGFCGFGDSCKFLHAREDYKQGWQLDKEWEKAGKTTTSASKVSTGKEDEGLDAEEKVLKEVPFKCVICKGEYRMPVVTRCGHYFCERCAMGRYMREKRKGCAVCGADTRGSFGVAKKLKELLVRKEKREGERAAKEAEEGT